MIVVNVFHFTGLHGDSITAESMFTSLHTLFPILAFKMTHSALGISCLRLTIKILFLSQKSRKQDNQEMGFNQNKSNKVTTFAGQRVASNFGIQDVIRNVTIKPETTRRQDDVTGRLPHASFTSSRMVRSSLGNSTIGSQNNAFQKVCNIILSLLFLLLCQS